MGFGEPRHVESGHVEFGTGDGLLPRHGVEIEGADGGPSSIVLQRSGQGAASDNVACEVPLVVEARCS